MSVGLEFPEETTGTVDYYGFKWGNMVVERWGIIRDTSVLGITVNKTRLEVHVSPTGRSVRVWKNGKELK